MPYAIHSYSIEGLVELLSQVAKAPPSQVNLKQHKNYFENYFEKLGAKTIVAEFDYIDHDYLEDYSSYYVKCFYDYRRKCGRFHFFQESFTNEDFSKILSSENDSLLEKLKTTYLGFIVAKPLPKTIIGRTCLTTYPCEDVRFFPITRDYNANLFGIELNVKTLAYQEQDQVAAACATSSLWSVFHGTGMLFHHAIPSPIEITQTATEKSPAEKRNLPNKGLTLEQMGHAIRDVGLDPFLVRATDEYILKSTAYGYLRARVPLVLAIQLVDTSTVDHSLIGGHAVAVTGFRVGPSEPKPMDGTGFLLRSTRIEKIYVHDDQIGPFARMEFDGITVNLENSSNGHKHPYPSLSSSWRGENAECGKVRALPQAVLVPLYHKIRIPFEIIHDLIFDFDSLIETLRTEGFIPFLPERIEWDIFLSQLNDFKGEVLTSFSIPKEKKESLLTAKMPKFIWRAIGSTQEGPVVEFLFDATDIEQGNLFIKSVEYNDDFHNFLKAISKIPDLVKYSSRSRAIFDWFSSQ